jgi:hypothetical protein
MGSAGTTLSSGALACHLIAANRSLVKCGGELERKR